VRQLQNLVEKCVVLSPGSLVPLQLLERALANQTQGGTGMLPFDEARRQFERDYLTQLLKLTGGNVSQAARLAQRNRTDFYALLGRHGIEPGVFKGTDSRD
jgi:two-component system response regulator GlrR